MKKTYIRSLFLTCLAFIGIFLGVFFLMPHESKVFKDDSPMVTDSASNDFYIRGSTSSINYPGHKQASLGFSITFRVYSGYEALKNYDTTLEIGSDYISGTKSGSLTRILGQTWRGFKIESVGSIVHKDMRKSTANPSSYVGYEMTTDTTIIITLEGQSETKRLYECVGAMLKYNGGNYYTPTLEFSVYPVVKYYPDPNGGTFPSGSTCSCFKLDAQDANVHAENAFQITNSNGDKVKQLAGLPEKTGYTFAGFYDELDRQYIDKDGKWKSGQPQLANLKAKWEANTYQIDLCSNDGTNKTTTIYATYDSSTLSSSITNPTRTGYTFGGWETLGGELIIDTSGKLVANTKYTNSSRQWTWYKNPDVPISLYAKWTANTYGVTLNANGGTVGKGKVNPTYDQDMPTLSSSDLPTWTGHTFQGFYDSTSGGTKYYEASGMSARTWNKAYDTTLYAHWTPNKYTINYEADNLAINPNTGGYYSITGYNTSTSSKPISSTQNIGIEATVNSITSTTATLIGFYLGTRGKATVGEKYRWSVDVWIAKSSKSSIKINAMGWEQMSTKTNVEITKTSKTITHEVVATGGNYSAFIFYAAAGQFAAGDVIGVSNLVIQKVDDLIDDKGSTYSSKALNSLSVEFDSAFNSTSLPTPTRNGYTFSYWHGNLFNKGMTAEKTGYYVNGAGSVTPNTEFSIYRLVVNPNKEYTITNSGGSNAPGYAIYDASNTYLTGSDYKNKKNVSVTTPSNARYMLVSVVTNSTYRQDIDTFEVDFKAVSGEKITITYTTTLKAKWTANSYTVKLNVNAEGGEFTSAPSGWTKSNDNIALTYSAQFDKKFDLPEMIKYNNGSAEHVISKTSYQFKGWSTSSSANASVEKTDGLKNLINIVNSGTYNLYAVWEETWAVSAEAPSGDGTSSSPYQISSANNLAWIAEQVQSENAKAISAYYEQTTNITDLADHVWLPIGESSTKCFKGTYDGKGYAIIGLKTLNQTNAAGTQLYSNVGLFGYTSSATIKNITLLGGEINGNDYSGSLVGHSENGLITYCQANTKVSTTGTGAGMIGLANGTVIKYCYNNGNISVSTNKLWSAMVSDMTIYASGKYFDGQKGSEVSNAEFSIYKIAIKPNAVYCITNSGGSTAPGYAIYDSENGRLNYKNYQNLKEVQLISPSNASYILLSVVTKTDSNRYDATTLKIEELAAAGGIVGISSKSGGTSLVSCGFEGKVTGDIRSAGLIVGGLAPSTTIQDCFGYYQKTENEDAPKIKGIAAKSGTVKTCIYHNGSNGYYIGTPSSFTNWVYDDGCKKFLPGDLTWIGGCGAGNAASKLSEFGYNSVSQ